MKWLNFLCWMLSIFYILNLGGRVLLEGIITEHPRAPGDEPPLFVFPGLGGFTCFIFALSITSLTVVETSLDESWASTPSKTGLQSWALCWLQRTLSLGIGFIAPFLSCSCFMLNILLVLATVLIGGIRKKKTPTRSWNAFWRAFHLYSNL